MCFFSFLSCMLDFFCVSFLPPLEHWLKHQLAERFCPRMFWVSAGGNRSTVHEMLNLSFVSSPLVSSLQTSRWTWAPWTWRSWRWRSSKRSWRSGARRVKAVPRRTTSSAKSRSSCPSTRPWLPGHGQTSEPRTKLLWIGCGPPPFIWTICWRLSVRFVHRSRKRKWHHFELGSDGRLLILHFV